MNARLEERITVPRAELEEFCRRNHVRKLAFFGSVLRDDFRPDGSDIDILVEFDPEHVPGYFRLSAMQRELSETFGRNVDLRTPGEISDAYRERVIASSEVIYESA
jgi:predicted nucleotidyltransferase